MELMNLSCEGFLEELASKAAAPGGGGASALVGAAGVALGSMVGSLTVGKKKYAAVEADIIALKVRAEALRADGAGIAVSDVGEPAAYHEAGRRHCAHVPIVLTAGDV